MKALSLTQPWAQLVAMGTKTLETRSWATAYKGPLAIQASKGFPKWARELCYEEPFLSALGPYWSETCPLGAIVGMVDMLGCLPIRATSSSLGGITIPPSEPELSFGDYSPKRFAWILEKPRQLRPFIPCKGALSLWDVPEEIEKELLSL